jgi:hypothetical protein
MFIAVPQLPGNARIMTVDAAGVVTERASFFAAEGIAVLSPTQLAVLSDSVFLADLTLPDEAGVIATIYEGFGGILLGGAPGRVWFLDEDISRAIAYDMSTPDAPQVGEPFPHGITLAFEQSPMLSATGTRVALGHRYPSLQEGAVTSIALLDATDVGAPSVTSTIEGTLLGAAFGEASFAVAGTEQIVIAPHGASGALPSQPIGSVHAVLNDGDSLFALAYDALWRVHFDGSPERLVDGADRFRGFGFGLARTDSGLLCTYEAIIDPAARTMTPLPDSLGIFGEAVTAAGDLCVVMTPNEDASAYTISLVAPSGPSVISSFSVVAARRAMLEHDSRLYFAGLGGVEVWDISDASEPTEEADVATDGATFVADVASNDDFLYVARFGVVSAYAWDALDAPVWSVDVPDEVDLLVAEDGTLLVAPFAEVLAFDAATGSARGSVPVVLSTPVSAAVRDRDVYVAELEGGVQHLRLTP